MIKPTVKRGLMLDFIPDEIICAESVANERIFKLNNLEIADGDIIYVMSREMRLEDNHAIVFGTELAEKRNKAFKILINPPEMSKQQEVFFQTGFKHLEKNLRLNDINFEVSKSIPKSAGAIIIDFNPTRKGQPKADCAVFEVDSHNIIPARFISDKQEFSAATLRRKIYANIGGFLTEYPNKFEIKATEAHHKLEYFLQNKFDYYNELRNDPNKDVTSGLSPYLHFGFTSSQRVALEVIKSDASRENQEAFLEELIVRKELSDNFCLYSKNFDSLEGAPDWAKETLDAHRQDIRVYSYTLEEFEQGRTHEAFWNKIQQNLVKTGKIHGYLRMYWAKKILEWSKSPEEALKIAIYLNDEYALDGRDSNGYVGILWSIGGVHDRPFSNRLVTGKIRYMSYDGCKKKFDVIKYTNEEIK